MAHPHFQKGPCSLYAQSMVSCSKFDSNHQKLQFPQQNLNMMNLVIFLYAHMVAKELPSLEIDTVESIQIQLLVLVGSPAVSQSDIFQEPSKIKK